MGLDGEEGVCGGDWQEKELEGPCLGSLAILSGLFYKIVNEQGREWGDVI